jgi:MFS family permease
LFSATFGNNAPSPLYAIYQHNLHLSALELTAIFATYAFGVLVALVLVGRLSDQIGRRPMLLIGSALLVATSLLFVFAQHLGTLFAARALQGIATGIVTATGAAAVVDVDPSRHRHASVLTTFSFASGASLGPLLFGVIAQNFASPTRLPYEIEFVLDVIGFIGLVLLVPRTERPSTRSTFRVPKVPREVLRPFALAGVAISTAWMLGGLYGSLSSTFDVQLLHQHSHAVAGLVIFLFNSVGAAGQLVMRRRPPRTTMVIAAGLLIVGVILVESALLATSSPLYFLGTIIAGTGTGLAFVGSLQVTNAIAPADRRAEVVTVYNVVAYLALSLPAVGVGLLATAWSLRSASIVFAIAVVALASYGAQASVRDETIARNDPSLSSSAA